MPDVNVKGRYRIYTHDGTIPLNFTSYNNSLCSIRRPNPNTFITISTYIPGSLSPFTTFDPGSSYTIVTKSNTADFSMGPYTRADRLPSSVTFRSPNFYHGLDKNSITVALSSYALSVNSPLSTVFTYIPNQDGYFINSISFNTERLRQGLPSLLTHLTPNSSYQFINRAPFTFFAPLQSEMGDAFALGNNSGGEYGMGYRYSQTMAFWDRGGLPFVLSADQTFGIWDKIVFNNNIQQVTWNGQTFLASSLAALSSCGTSKALFVLGSNLYGQLGTGSSQQYYPTWTKIAGQWLDIEMGAAHLVAINHLSNVYACGSNAQGQLGLGPGVVSTNTLTLVEDQIPWVQIATLDYSTFLRNSEGQVLGCGNNTSGQLGIGNTITPIFDFTEEITYSQWKSIKTSKTFDNLIALKDGSLYGCGLRNRIYGGGSDTLQTRLTREILNLADITDFYTTGIGTFIRRQGQDYLFAAGESGSTNKLATLTGTSNQPYFTKTTIPSNVKNIFSNYSIVVNAGEFYNLGYIGSNSDVYSKAYNNNTFTQKQFKAFDSFSSTGAAFSQMQSPIFLLSAASHFRPTPTPTITLTPTVTPTPTITPTVSRPPVFLPPKLSKVVVFYQENNDSPLKFIYFSDNGSGLGTTPSLQISFNDYNRLTSTCAFDIEKGNSSDLVRIRRIISSEYSDMQKSVNLTNLITPVKNLPQNANTKLMPPATLCITPSTTTFPNGIYILGYCIPGGAYETTYIELQSYDKGQTWSQTFSIDNIAYERSPSNNEYDAPIIIRRFTNSSYNNTNTRTGTLLMRYYSQDVPYFTGYIGKNLYYSERITRTFQQNDPDLLNYATHNFRYDNYDVPYVIITNAIKQVLLYTPNFNSNGSLNTQSPWKQLFKFTDNLAAFYLQAYTGDTKAFPNSFKISHISIAFDRNNNNLLYYSYALKKNDFNGYNQGIGGIAVGTYNTATGERTNRYAFRTPPLPNINFTADVSSINGIQIIGHDLIVDSQNQLWMFVLCNSDQSTGQLNYLYVLKYNSGANVWQLVLTKTTSSTSLCLNLLPGIVYK